MSFVPDEELKERSGLTLAPMIDFLFLMLAIFASLAVSRFVMKDTEIDLVKTRREKSVSLETNRDCKLIHVAISDEGKYKWITEVRDYYMQTASDIAQELTQQYAQGLLPDEKEKTTVLLKIDKNAKWEPILQALLAIKEAGFNVRPVYEPL